MAAEIKNIDDLRYEIAKLKRLEGIQREEIRERFSSPSAIISSIFSVFQRSETEGEKRSGLFDGDIFQILSSLLLPFILNNTFFKQSSGIVKTIVGLVSQKAADYINKDLIANVWETIKKIIPGLKGTENAESLTVSDPNLFV
jgi:hypothetical protein